MGCSPHLCALATQPQNQYQDGLNQYAIIDAVLDPSDWSAHRAGWSIEPVQQSEAKWNEIREVPVVVRGEVLRLPVQGTPGRIVELEQSTDLNHWLLYPREELKLPTSGALIFFLRPRP